MEASRFADEAERARAALFARGAGGHDALAALLDHERVEEHLGRWQKGAWSRDPGARQSLAPGWIPQAT